MGKANEFKGQRMAGKTHENQMGFMQHRKEKNLAKP